MSVLVLVALFVTLIPTTIGALLSAIGIAGMDRLVRFNVLAMSGRAVEAAGDVDTLLLDKTGTITLGNRQATEFLPVRASPSASWPTRPSSPRCPTRRRRAARSSCWPRRSTTSAAARWRRCTRKFIPFSAQTRHQRHRRRRRLDPQGRGRCGASPMSRAGPTTAHAGRRAEIEAIAEKDRQGGRHAAGRRQGRQAAGRHPPQGHRQGRHPRALRDPAQDGHPHGHDHRRQPADRGGHRRRIGRRRLPRPGDARGQAQADPRGAGPGQAGRDVRRRHQRRAGARPGRCRRRHEYRHHGRARGRQHGRSRQRPDQADRDRRDRQAAPDDPRRARPPSRSPTTWRSTSPSSRRCSSPSIRSSRRSTSCVCRRRRAPSCRPSSSMR